MVFSFVFQLHIVNEDRSLVETHRERGRERSVRDSNSEMRAKRIYLVLCFVSGGIVICADDWNIKEGGVVWLAYKCHINIISFVFCHYYCWWSGVFSMCIMLFSFLLFASIYRFFSLFLIFSQYLTPPSRLSPNYNNLRYECVIFSDFVVALLFCSQNLCFNWALVIGHDNEFEQQIFITQKWMRSWDWHNGQFVLEFKAMYHRNIASNKNNKKEKIMNNRY